MAAEAVLSGDIHLVWHACRLDGDKDRIATTGFSKMSDRQVALWETGSLSNVKTITIDQTSGVLMPSGLTTTSSSSPARGSDGNICYYEYEDDNLFLLAEYKFSKPQRGMCFFPRRSLSMSDCQIACALKVVANSIEGIAFIVPCKSDSFQSDIFPPVPSAEHTLSAAEFFSGKNAPPKLISLDNGSVFSALGSAPSQAAAPAPAPTKTMSTPPPAATLVPAPVIGWLCHKIRLRTSWYLISVQGLTSDSYLVASRTIDLGQDYPKSQNSALLELQVPCSRKLQDPHLQAAVTSGPDIFKLSDCATLFAPPLAQTLAQPCTFVSNPQFPPPDVLSTPVFGIDSTGQSVASRTLIDLRRNHQKLNLPELASLQKVTRPASASYSSLTLFAVTSFHKKGHLSMVLQYSMTCALAEDDWQRNVHCFSDMEGHYSQLLITTTQIVWKEAPELAYVLRGSTANDPLLSWLWVQDVRSALYKYPDGLYALSPDLLHSWTRLEKGLLFISDVLIFNANNSASWAIFQYLNWRPPNDFEYCSGCPLPEKAYGRVLRARDVFMLLAARCSLAISLWLPYPPNRAGEAVLAWIQCLQNNGVPQCWIDTLQQSIITDFSLGLRIGAVIDVRYCAWPGLILTMQRANVPLFVHWSSGPDGINELCQRYPLLQAFRPGPGDAWQAVQAKPMKSHGPHPPTMNTAIAYKQERMPFGPFQFPGESRECFLERMDRKAAALAQVDTPKSITERAARIEAVAAHQFPLEDVQEEWVQLDYRAVVPSGAVMVVWLSHPTACRRYNPFLDEWDIWELADESTEQDGLPVISKEEARDTQAVPPPSTPAPLPTPVSEALEKEAQQAMEEDLQVVAAHRAALSHYIADDSGPVFSENYWTDWYGLHLRATPLLSSRVEYAKYDTPRLSVYFGQQSEHMPSDPLVRKVLAGYVSAVLDRQENKMSRIADTDIRSWDLNLRSPFFLPNTHPCPFSAIKKCTALDPNNRQHPAFIIRYHHDPDPSLQPWRLMVDAVTLLFLWQQHEVLDSRCAIVKLLGVRAAFGTVCTVPLDSFKQSRHCLAPLPYRLLTYRTTTRDYTDYTSHLLDLLHQPHMRAALMRGGIIWRLLIGVMSKHCALWDIFVEAITSGPSLDPTYHDLDGYVEVDDELLMEELDLISGVYKVKGNKLKMLLGGQAFTLGTVRDVYGFLDDME
ncbi:hypothetical protein C8T65DRAFT_773284 [Cerioporus squamosus]|nr:hypothetical protein C8T65DRAFT_773284 [Cerioporus squamosus]